MNSKMSVFERVVAALAIVLYLPVLAAVAVAIRIESGYPGMETTEYTTGSGGSVRVLRFATRGEVGLWLRRTHLDWLPAIWNVMRGEIGLGELRALGRA
jgi:lipopolysaccharide/colanic/teichoic acid biosynthesis glycosyltransferase